jgi:hypothetical protein
MRTFAPIKLALLLALALSTAASVAVHTAPPATADTTATESACSEPAQEPNDDTLLWRLRAYRNLDCVMAIVDEHLAKGGSSVTFTREELQDIRARALWAKDAAARIGRWLRAPVDAR